MKKLIITLGILTSVAVGSSYGQGTLFFNNTGGTRVSTNSGTAGGAVGAGLAGAASTGQNFYFALFYSTTQSGVSGNTANIAGTNGVYAFNASGWTDGSAGAYGTNGAAGRFAATVQNSDGSYSVAGLAGGTSAAFTIIAWSANIGTSITSLEAYLALANAGLAPMTGYVGQSAVSGAFAVGTLGSTPAATIMGAASPNIPGFVVGEIVGVPEPTTLALAALGGASLLMFRRKK